MAAAKDRQPERSVCPEYNSLDGCKLGRQCPKLHVCRFHFMGNCKHGNNCRLEHAVNRQLDGHVKKQVSGSG